MTLLPHVPGLSLPLCMSLVNLLSASLPCEKKKKTLLPKDTEEGTEEDQQCSIFQVPLHFWNWHLFQMKMFLVKLFKICISIPRCTTTEGSHLSTWGAMDLPATKVLCLMRSLQALISFFFLPSFSSYLWQQTEPGQGCVCELKHTLLLNSSLS